VIQELNQDVPDAEALWVGGMSHHVQRRSCHSSGYGRKKNVW
jgi:hypothetical protein